MNSLKSILDSFDVTSRKNRRKIVEIIKEIEKIRDNEEAYIQRIPLNLQNGDAYADAENSVETLNEVIDTLIDVY